nr:reverse transcriptase domain-containing protein [Tanacetum cinerariifolium]
MGKVPTEMELVLEQTQQGTSYEVSFGPSIKSLLTNNDKLCELASPLNEHYSVVLLKKLPKQLGDPNKFMIPCDFPRMAECLAMADLGESINLMPLSMWNKLSLPDLSPTCMTLELVDRLISRSVGVVEHVFVKVGTFQHPADFVVVDFDADPRVPLILRRSILKTVKALIDVFEGKLTLRVGKEAITFNLDQTSRYSANYNDMTANRIDVINMAYKEHSQEVLGFFDVIVSSNPTPYYDPIVSTTSLTLTPFGNSDFLLEEVDAFLALKDNHTSPEEISCPVHKDLKICEAKTDKSSIDEPPEVELKDLLPHLEYTFLEGDDKLPVFIVKDMSVEEKTALITILMEEDFEPAIQHQRRVNPRIHDVIKNEVLKLLDAGLIYLIFDSPWVMQCTGYVSEVYEFHDMIEKTIEVFMDDFLVFRNSFQNCLSHLEKMLKRCEDTKLCLNWEKSHFMVKEGIVLDHKISKEWIEVDKAKVDVITKLPHPTTVKGIQSFLGHVGFYRRFIQDFSKIATPMTRLLEKDTPFLFSKECVKAFQTLKRKLTEAPILIALD